MNSVKQLAAGIVLVLSGILLKPETAGAQVLAPIQVTLSDSSYAGSNYICAQPWNYWAFLSTTGNNGGTPVDSVGYFIDWGDGNQQTFFELAYNQSTTYSVWNTVTHTYSSGGIYSLFIIATSYSGGVAQHSDTLALPSYLLIDYCESVSGQVYVDVNNDCTFNSGDVPVPYAPILITNTATSQVSYIYTNNSGYYSTQLPAGGNYTIEVSSPFNASAYNCTSGPTHNFNLSGSYTHDFSLHYTASGFDLAIGYANTVISLNGGRYLSFNITELVNLSAQIANVTVTLPNGITPNYCSRPYSLSGNVMTFDPVSITPFMYYYNSNYFYMNFYINQSLVQIGDTVCFTIHTDPVSGDVNTSNNTQTLCAVVVNSYDPNNKLVSPQGTGSEGAITPGETLKYTVNFQNTGNATAYNIDVVDTLDADLDLASFHLDYTSHPCQVIQNGHTITFRFNNINLPDSNSNEPQSHGFIQYSINTPSNASAGTEFTNTAYIYFDYNPAVVTNTTLNSIQSLSVEDVNGDVFLLSVYPNPASNTLYIQSEKPVDGSLSITDMNGKTMVLQNMNTQNTMIDVSALSAGIYILKIQTGSYTEQHKIVIR